MLQLLPSSFYITYCLYGWLYSAIFTIVFVVISASRFNFCADTSKRLQETNGLLIMRLNRAVYRYFKVQTAYFFFSGDWLCQYQLSYKCGTNCSRVRLLPCVRIQRRFSNKRNDCNIKLRHLKVNFVSVALLVVSAFMHSMSEINKN